jgi:hypothetical protein
VTRSDLSWCSPTYLPTYLPALPTYLPTYQPTYLPTDLPPPYLPPYLLPTSTLPTSPPSLASLPPSPPPSLPWNSSKCRCVTPCAAGRKARTAGFHPCSLAGATTITQPSQQHSIPTTKRKATSSSCETNTPSHNVICLCVGEYEPSAVGAGNDKDDNRRQRRQ